MTSLPSPAVETSRLQLLYHISRELGGHLELNELVGRILRLTTESVGAENSSLILVNEDGAVYEGALIVNGVLVPDASAQLSRQLERGLAGWSLRRQSPALVANTAADSRWQRSGATRGLEAKSALAAPLLYAGRSLGVLTLVHSVPEHFGRSDEELATAIAEQAAIAVENARLLRESREQTQTVRNLLETAQVLSSTLDPNKLLRLLLNQAQKHLRLEAASIALIDHEKVELFFHVATGLAAAKVVGTRIKLGQGIAGWVAQTGQGVVVTDTQADPRFYSLIDEQVGIKTRAILCAPIQFEGRIIGVLEGINPAPGTLDRNTLPLLTNIANLAGNAIARVQQYTSAQAAKTRYSGLFEEGFDAVLITDLKGFILEANRKAGEMLGYARMDLVGMSINAIHRPATGPLRVNRLPDLAAGAELAFDTRFTTHDSRIAPVEVRAKRIAMPDQVFIQWIVRDNTDKMRADEKRSEHVSMIFHDMRTPLNNLLSSLTVLDGATPPDDKAARSVLNIAQRAGQQLSQLVESLLTLRRLEAGEVALNKEEVSLVNLIVEAAELVRPAAASRLVTFESRLPQQLPVARVDAGLLRRVLVNLLENAVKYSPRQGVVRLAARLEEVSIVVSVTDSGPGIPYADQDRIFEKFTRLNPDEVSRGMGLGLAFCRWAVTAHGGRIWVDSQPGHGATFSFSVPMTGQ
ncbi:MAG: GAF domain-containing protein, partial [Chloroflexi bacterium]|nr:GAF domain-containing protein [Chloroflexota bacterium]